MNMERMIRLLFQAMLVFGISFSDALSQEEDDHYGPQSMGAEAAAAWNLAMREKHGEDETKLLLDGLVADKESRTVEILAEATGLPSGDTPEFILIDTGSSHGYEALFWSMAKPSDVHQALEFVGIQSGGGRNPAALRFWASGDSVRVLIQDPGGETYPIEETILDMKEDRAMSEEGFLFTGSVMVTLPNQVEQPPAYAADIYDPRSILPLYNDMASVLDIPREAHQGEVYGNYSVNPDRTYEHGQMVSILMMPGEGANALPPLEYRLQVTTSTNATNDLFFVLFSGTNDTAVFESGNLTPMLERIVEGADEKRIPILTLEILPDAPVGDLSRLCRILMMMETFGQARVNPPAEGQLFYRAFAPATQWATPEGRPAQPWELHLSTSAEGVISGRLVLHESTDENRSSGEITNTFALVEHSISVPVDIPKVLLADAMMREASGRMQPPPVLLVFVDSGLAYGKLMDYLEPVRLTYGTIYVFNKE